MKRLTSSSSESTKELAADIARDILKHGPGKHAAVLALDGDLGAGKTTFVQGFFKGLGIKKAPPSPTFILMRRTALRRKAFKNVFHVDAYRADEAAFRSIGMAEVLADPKNIVLIEWASRIKKLLPKDAHYLKFAHGRHSEERKITLPS